MKKEKKENINILFLYKLVVFKEHFANLDTNRACNPIAQEASGAWAQGQRGLTTSLHSNFEARLEYRVRLCLKTTTTKKKS